MLDKYVRQTNISYYNITYISLSDRIVNIISEAAGKCIFFHRNDTFDTGGYVYYHLNINRLNETGVDDEVVIGAADSVKRNLDL